MTIAECVESWINGNLSTVINDVINRSTPAEVAYYSAEIALALSYNYNDVQSQTFLHLLAARIRPPLKG